MDEKVERQEIKTSTKNFFVIVFQVKLDREERDQYTLILNVHDLGSPPQQTSRLLNVVVKDVDDHSPVFNRQRVRVFHYSNIRI